MYKNLRVYFISRFLRSGYCIIKIDQLRNILLRIETTYTIELRNACVEFLSEQEEHKRDDAIIGGRN